MKKLLSVLLILAILAGCLAACGGEPATPSVTQTDPTESAAATLSAEEEAILAQRRDLVESYMREMANVLWRAEDTMEYYRSDFIPINIVAGRLYRGIPYAHAAAGLESFVGFSTGEDGGILSIGGLHPDMLGSKFDNIRRVGNDCSGAMQVAWAQLGADIEPSWTAYMAPATGFIRVGNYVAAEDNNKGSAGVCSANGEQTMYEAYALMQKADAAVYDGHTMMVVSVQVERNSDGTIDGEKSFATVLHQTGSYIVKETKAYDEALGEDVYQTYGIDDEYTFAYLFEKGVLPVTCRAFIDPTFEIPEPAVTDSLTQPGQEDLFAGEFVSNYFISFVDVTVTDASGAVAQQARAFADRKSIRNFQLSEFTGDPNRIMGAVDTAQLAPGTYTVRFVCQIVTGQRFDVRQVTVTVE